MTLYSNIFLLLMMQATKNLELMRFLYLYVATLCDVEKDARGKHSSVVKLLSLHCVDHTDTLTDNIVSQAHNPLF